MVGSSFAQLQAEAMQSMRLLISVTISCAFHATPPSLHVEVLAYVTLTAHLICYYIADARHVQLCVCANMQKSPACMNDFLP